MVRDSARCLSNSSTSVHSTRWTSAQAHSGVWTPAGRAGPTKQRWRVGGRPPKEGRGCLVRVLGERHISLESVDGRPGSLGGLARGGLHPCAADVLGGLVGRVGAIEIRTLAKRRVEQSSPLGHRLPPISQPDPRSGRVGNPLAVWSQSWNLVILGNSAFPSGKASSSVGIRPNPQTAKSMRRERRFEG